MAIATRRPATVRRAVRRILVGTSGFSYPAWRGTFYPPGLPARDMLSTYARSFGTVEINHTFRRLPTPTLLRGWARQTPTSFRFTLKAPQRITHQLRLRGAEESTQLFCQRARALGVRLGPLLFQLPPYLRFDPERLATFLAALPRGLEATFEFRSDTWFNDETYRLLAQHRVALCVADAERLATPLVATGPFGYLRLRRADYTTDELDAWAERIRTTGRWRRVYVYFKHEDSGRGPELARAFLDRLT